MEATTNAAIKALVKQEEAARIKRKLGKASSWRRGAYAELERRVVFNLPFIKGQAGAGAIAGGAHGGGGGGAAGGGIAGSKPSAAAAIGGGGGGSAAPEHGQQQQRGFWVGPIVYSHTHTQHVFAQT